MTKKHLLDTEFWHKLMHGIYGPRQGGAKILIDAEDAMTGVGKTSAAVALARFLARAFSYELEPDDFVLSGQQYISRYRQHPGKEQPSVLVLDELVGGGAGDARRAMSNKNVSLIRAWNMLRAKRVVTLVTLPDWNDADTNLQKLADYRLWCRKQPIGCFQSYEIGTHFNKKGNVKTRGLGPGDTTTRIFFPNMHGQRDEFYQHLSDQKDTVLDSGEFDADEATADDDDEEREMPKRQQAMVARSIKLEEDIPWTEVPKHDDRLTYSGDYLRRVSNNVLSKTGDSQEGTA